MNRSATTTAHSDFLSARGAALDESGCVAAHFSDPDTELTAFTSSAALVDRSSATCLLQEGTDALDLLHRLSTNDLIELEKGDSRFTVLTSERGRIIDVLHVVILEPGKLLLLSESPNAQAAIDWIEKFTIIEDSTVRDATPQFARLALIGPTAVQIAGSAFGVDLTANRVGSAVSSNGEIVLVASKWAKTDRVDVIMPRSDLEATWNRIVESGALPSGETAFQAARIAGGVPSPETELNEEFNPLEVGLSDLISFTKGCYVGQEVIARLDTYDKVQKRLVLLESDHPVAPGTSLTSSGKRAGTVTSVSPLATDGKVTALGFARRDSWEDGTVLDTDGGTVEVRELSRTAPFA